MPARTSASAVSTPDVLPILECGDPVLRRPADPVDPARLGTAELRRLVARMRATMEAAPGVGLAAPQVGVGAQVFAVNVAGHPKAVTTHGTFVLCNAKVIEASRWKVGREGCLSVPDLTGDVKRAGRIVVEAVAPGSGEPVTITTDAFEARALQHEIDHCAGKLFLDRVAAAHAIYQRKVYL